MIITRKAIHIMENIGEAKNEIAIVDKETVENLIYIVRGQKVMLDVDLARIYGYETRRFNEQVKNNSERFDDDFRFQLTKPEFENLMSKNSTSSWGGTRKLPYAFTETGIYMLMTVLKGDLAIAQSKALIRIFKGMKDYISENRALIGTDDIARLAIQTSENTAAIAKITDEMLRKSDLPKIFKNFASSDTGKEFLIMNGQLAEADAAYQGIYAKAKKLKGCPIYMDIVSVGATINVMLSAVLAKGTTIIDNAAKEPHIVDVANFLNTMGADIRGAGTDVIKINGVEKLKGNATYSVVPDQIEAGTFMLAAVATKGDLTLKNCITKHLESITAKIIEVGGNVEDNGDSIRVWCNKRPNKANIKTLPYPGFPTDLQPQMGVVLSLANGTSVINESIWDSRFQYTDELNKMGAKITAQGKSAFFEGVKKLSGAPVYSTDLRAGAALVVAATAAEGKTEIYNLEHIDRGYENIEEKFRQIGAKIERVIE